MGERSSVTERVHVQRGARREWTIDQEDTHGW